MGRHHNRKRWNIPIERKREVLAFCREYPNWQKELRASPNDSALIALISLVDQTAREADPFIHEYLIRAVTECLPYTAFWGIPCSDDYYYDRRKKFLFLLDRKLRERDQRKE